MGDKKSHTFFTGAFIGVLMGLLLASKENSKKSFEEFLDSIKEIDIEEIKDSFISRLSKIEDNLQEMPNEKKLAFLENKLEKIKEGCTKIIEIAEEKNVPKAIDAAKIVESKANEILKHINDYNKEENSQEKIKPKSKKKKITAVKKAQVKKKSETSKKN